MIFAHLMLWVLADVLLMLPVLALVKAAKDAPPPPVPQIPDDEFERLKQYTAREAELDAMQARFLELRPDGGHGYMLGHLAQQRVMNRMMLDGVLEDGWVA